MTSPSVLFTCLACHVAFHSSDSQREHYKAEWHRYNLKRKITDLPPVSELIFSQKLSLLNAKIDNPSSKSKLNFNCNLCSKSYSTLKALENHCVSKKHIEKIVNVDESVVVSTTLKKETTATVVEDAEASAMMGWRKRLALAKSEEEFEDLILEKLEGSLELGLEDCLFCQSRAVSFEKNIEHMTCDHSFFIPDIEYLVDLKGLFTHLAQKVSAGNICLHCNGKGKQFYSLDSVRKHMIDKGHCKILYDDGAEDEFTDYYNFSIGRTNDDGEWEDIEDENENQTSDDTQSVMDSKASTTFRRSDLLQASYITDDSTELILPSGRRAGARQFRKYWDQTLRPDEKNEAILINRLIGDYRNLAVGRNFGGIMEIRKQDEIKRLDIQQRRVQSKLEMRAQHDLRSRIGMKANGLQKHFRHQNPL